MSGFFWRRELGQLVAVSAPLAAGYLAEMAMAFTAMVIVGRLGAVELAGVGLGANLLLAVTLVAMGLLSVVGVLAAQAHGAGQDAAVGRAMHQGFFLSSLVAVPVTVAGFFPAPMLRLLGQEEAVVQVAQDYLRMAVWSFLPYLYFTVLRNFVAALLRPRSVMVVTLAAVALNLLLCWVLVFGELGFPALGVAGAGLATTIVSWSMAVALGVYAGRSAPFRPYRLFARDWTIDPGLIGDILRYGIPVALAQAVETVLFSGITVLMGVLGATVLAAHHVAAGIASIAFMIPLAMAHGTAMRVAHAIGRGEPRRARGIGFLAIGVAGIYMAVVAVIMWALPVTITGIYLDTGAAENAPVLSLAVSLLGIAAVFQVVDGVQALAAGALRGLRDTVVPLLVVLLCFWGFGLGGGWLFAFPLGLGGLGLWWAAALGLAVTAVLLTWRFAHRTAVLVRAAPDGG